jgi:FkbM family methyltransferase
MAELKRVAKKIYRALPLKRQLFTVVRAVFTPPKALYQHLSFEGPFVVRMGTERFKIFHYGYQIENGLFWQGLRGWEEESLAIWRDLCGKADTILDVGANTGVYALVAKTTNPCARVMAFEPVSRIFEKLVTNCALNGYDIECVNAALSDSDGDATIYDLPSEHLYSVTVNKNLNPPGQTVMPVKIKINRLDTLLASDPKLSSLDLMKIDVETHEPEVLMGMGALLERFKPTLLIEILNQEVAARVQSLLGPLKYCYFAVDESSGLREVGALGEGDARNYLACSESRKSLLATHLSAQ